MRENFLHYIWKHKKFNVVNLKTTQNETIILVSVGEHNHNSGPDFFNAQLKIDNQLWAGNIEIHVKASDWFVHNHENDRAYDNVILHVVYECDIDVHRSDNSVIPTLELKSILDASVISNYKMLFSKPKKFINCESEFATTSLFVLNNWLDRLFIERLERKANLIEDELVSNTYNWEAVLFKMLTKNFGLKVNGEAFNSIAKSLDYSMVRKVQSSGVFLEALLFGQARLLEDDMHHSYYLQLQKDYNYLKQKFGISNEHITKAQFFRLRPANFPTIRLAQLASLYATHNNLFSKIINIHKLDDFYDLFKISASIFWDSHFSFNSESKLSKKQLTRSFINLLLMNTIIPIKLCYAKHNGKNIDDQTLSIARQMASENNTITNAFKKLNQPAKSALESQALIQLKTEYCEKNKCLQCAVGNALIMK